MDSTNNNKKAFSTIGRSDEYNDETMMFHTQSLGMNNSKEIH